MIDSPHPLAHTPFTQHLMRPLIGPEPQYWPLIGQHLMWPSLARSFPSQEISFPHSPVCHFLDSISVLPGNTGLWLANTGHVTLQYRPLIGWEQITWPLIGADCQKPQLSCDHCYKSPLIVVFTQFRIRLSLHLITRHSGAVFCPETWGHVFWVMTSNSQVILMFYTPNLSSI